MWKKSLLYFVLFGLSIAHAHESRVLDFSKLDPFTIPGYVAEEWEEIDGDLHPFNKAMELGPYFYFLKNAFDIDTAIETGTGSGETTEFLSLLFESVYTCENHVDTFLAVQPKLRAFCNVQMSFGNSPDILRQLLPPLRGTRVLFYLDARTSDYRPLQEELEVIGSTHKDNCILVINDFKVPRRADIPCDLKNSSISFIRHHLNKVFSGYICYYLIPKNLESRAKVVFLPKKWVYEKSLYPSAEADFLR